MILDTLRPTSRARAQESLLQGVLLGAAAGLLGTVAMTPVMTKLSQLASKKQEQGGQQQSPPQEPATEKAARKALQPLGVQVEGERKKKLGNWVHYGYGTFWGAVYGALWPRLPLLGRLFGLGFGSALFLLGDEVAVPALKLGPPPQKTPVGTHLSALAAHLVYGATTDATLRGLSRLARA